MNYKNYKEEKKYVGHTSQLLRVNKIQLQEGKADGVTMVDVHNRSGMHFDVNISRGLDITHLDFLGENCSFISSCGIVASEYFDDKDLGFLKSFTAGFLTTCGLKTIGAPSEYGGNAYGLHGNISHTPAEEVTCTIEEDGENPYVLIRGRVKDTVIFGDKLVLEREIRCRYKERKISIRDKVINDGYKEAHHMILYHCNIGYPLLTPDSEIFIPSKEIKARTPHAEAGINDWMKSQVPDPDYEEMCYYHKLKADEDNMTVAAVFNHDLGMGVAVMFDSRGLDHFVQWKMMGAGDYVMGLEPCSSTIEGVDDAIKNGSMKYIKPGECAEYTLDICLLRGAEELEALKQKFK